MLRKLLLLSIFGILAYGFWISPDFKTISAGVAIFLFGMMSLEDGFKSFTGGVLENMLSHSTDKLWKSLSFGIISTTLMQSSSLVSIITISFLSAGFISLVAGIGIIFGANLGTTTGAWLVAGYGIKINIAAYAMPMIVFGVILLFQQSKQLKGLGYILVGLGFLFLGIHYMKDGFDSFKDKIDLTAYAVSGYKGVLLFALIGTIATVIMQSSHATLVLIITALAAHQITYENALALAIGANIGTTITAILGAVSANVNGRRLALAHLVFNVVTALVAILFIFQLTDLVDKISAWFGIAEKNYTLKLAVFHTLFNGLGILLMLPLIKQLERFLMWALRPKVRTAAQPRFLHKVSMNVPDAMLEAVHKETLHLYENAFDVLAGALRLRPDDIRSTLPLEEIVKRHRMTTPINIETQYNETIKNLYGEIVEYISLAQSNLNREQLEKLFSLRTAGREIVEAIKDTKHFQKNLDAYLASRNPELRKEYRLLRLKLAEALRELERIRNNDDSVSTILDLDHLKLKMKETDYQLNQRLSEKIRNHLITPEQATSLIKDSHYAYDITKNLVKMGAALFSVAPNEIQQVEQQLALEDSELESLLSHKTETKEE